MICSWLFLYSCLCLSDAVPRPPAWSWYLPLWSSHGVVVYLPLAIVHRRTLVRLSWRTTSQRMKKRTWIRTCRTLVSSWLFSALPLCLFIVVVVVVIWCYGLYLEVRQDRFVCCNVFILLTPYAPGKFGEGPAAFWNVLGGGRGGEILKCRMMLFSIIRFEFILKVKCHCLWSKWFFFVLF